MRELALVMPEGSWLQSADASVLGDPATGATTGGRADRHRDRRQRRRPT